MSVKYVPCFCVHWFSVRWNFFLKQFFTTYRFFLNNYRLSHFGIFSLSTRDQNITKHDPNFSHVTNNSKLTTCNSLITLWRTLKVWLIIWITWILDSKNEKWKIQFDQNYVHASLKCIVSIKITYITNLWTNTFYDTPSRTERRTGFVPKWFPLYYMPKWRKYQNFNQLR
jgi:hypothetical protein